MTIFLQLRVYISQFDFISQNCKFMSQNCVYINSEKKVRIAKNKSQNYKVTITLKKKKRFYSVVETGFYNTDSVDHQAIHL